LANARRKFPLTSAGRRARPRARIAQIRHDAGGIVLLILSFSMLRYKQHHHNKLALPRKPHGSILVINMSDTSSFCSEESRARLG